MIQARGAVLLCNLPPVERSPDLRESVREIGKHSQFPVWTVNVRHGFPPPLARIKPAAVLVHYSCFYGAIRLLNDRYRDWLLGCESTHKVAFLQDEQSLTRMKLEFLRDFGFGTVFSCLRPPHAESLYRSRTGVSNVISYYPGYVGDRLLAARHRWLLPDCARTIDVGYRGRRLPDHWGALAAEKAIIADEFPRRITGRGLQIDVSADEKDRLRGDAWYRFLASCRATLGTESGASHIDPDAQVPAHEERHGRQARTGANSPLRNPAPAVPGHDERFPYRTISPRHLEAAAFEVCQILFEGQYAGLLRPGEHFICLRKDFSNLASVLYEIGDPARRLEVAQAAKAALFDEPSLRYPALVGQIDGDLLAAGIHVPVDRNAEHLRVRSILRSQPWRRLQEAVALTRSYWTPARDVITARMSRG